MKKTEPEDDYAPKYKRSLFLLGVAFLICMGSMFNPIVTVATVVGFILFYNAYQISFWMFPNEQKRNNK